MGIEHRIFIGLLLSKEIKMHLSQSAAWKEAKLIGKQELIETQESEKEYIGRFIPSPISCFQLKKIMEEIKSQMNIYFPKLNLEKQHTYLLTQLFFH